MRHRRWLHLSLFIFLAAGCGSASRNAPHDPWPAEREGDDGAGQQPMGYAAGAWSDDDPAEDEDARADEGDDGSESADVDLGDDDVGAGGDDIESDDGGGDDFGDEDDDDDIGIDIEIGDDEDSSEW